MPDQWSGSDQFARRRELVEEQIRRGAAITTPPVINLADLGVGLWCGLDR
jgi:hypothetical protein